MAAPSTVSPSSDLPVSVTNVDDDHGPAPPAMHQGNDLHTSALLNLILGPDLEDNLTADALVTTDNRSLFHLLPLVLVAIQRIGQSSQHRDTYVKLVSTLHSRVVACRGLKLRFLLLIQNPSFATNWDARLVHRRDAYSAAQRTLRQILADADARKAATKFLSHANSETSRSLEGSKLVSTLSDNKALIRFAVENLLHPELGIHRRSISFRLRTVRSAFLGSELVDAIMERTNITHRRDVRDICLRLINLGLISLVGSHARKFVDDRRHVYQCSLSVNRTDAGHVRVMTSSGSQLSCWEEVKEGSRSIKQIEIQIPMDMIDLQSFDFWTSSVYVKGVEKGYRYGFRSISHPLHCEGVDSHSYLDVPTAPAPSDNGEADLSDSNITTINSYSSEDLVDFYQDSAVAASVLVRKVFSSIARPMIIQLRVPMENADLDDNDLYATLRPGLLVKEGDNLMQDMGVELMFLCFNHIWEHTPRLKKKYGMVPFSLSYEVFPTSTTQGFMEAVTGLTSLKEYDWRRWRRTYGKDKERVNEMVLSAVGSYVGAYVVGGRDRHFDNVLIKDDMLLMHIDFGFLMGTSPPIDGPPIAIAPQMEVVFRELGVWDTFVDLFLDAFAALREHAPAIIRTSVMIFSMAGYREDEIRNFLRGRGSLNVDESDEKAIEWVKKQLVMSSGDIKTRFKQFAHEHIDPAWYGLLEKGFPPAVAIMKLVDAKEQKAAKNLSKTKTASVREEEKIHVR